MHTYLNIHTLYITFIHSITHTSAEMLKKRNKDFVVVINILKAWCQVAIGCLLYNLFQLSALVFSVYTTLYILFANTDTYTHTLSYIQDMKTATLTLILTLLFHKTTRTSTQFSFYCLTNSLSFSSWSLPAFLYGKTFDAFYSLSFKVCRHIFFSRKKAYFLLFLYLFYFFLVHFLCLLLFSFPFTDFERLTNECFTLRNG